MSKPTPRPWAIGHWLGTCDMDHAHSASLCKYRYTLNSEWDDSHNSISSIKDPISVVCTTTEYGAMTKADAAHIVKCVNMHEELVEMLYECRDKIHEFGTPIKEGKLFSRISELLAKAEGGVE